MKREVEIWTDGACKGNPGPGGWGVLLKAGKYEKELFGGQLETTNNQMELTAVIKALGALTESCHVKLYTDSTYVMKGMTQWINGWKANRWLTSSKKPVKNVELWQELDTQVQRHDIDWIWVKGHSTNAGNNRADELANQGVKVALNN